MWCCRDLSWASLALLVAGDGLPLDWIRQKNHIHRFLQFRKISTNFLNSLYKIFFFIRKTEPFTVPGLDGFQSVISNHHPTKAIIQLTNIITTTIKLQYFPNTWKQAIFKQISKKLSTCSIMDSLFEILEIILLKQLNWCLIQKKTIIVEQFCFQKTGKQNYSSRANSNSPIIWQWHNSIFRDHSTILEKQLEIQIIIQVQRFH